MQCDQESVKPSGQSPYLHMSAPIAAGTGSVESVLSAIMRLARDHSLTTLTLVERIILPAYFEYTGESLCKSFITRKHLMKIHISFLSGDLWQIIEQLTGRRDLYTTTLAPIMPFMSKWQIKHSRAWCPLCLQDAKDRGQVVHEKLLWVFNTVRICKNHKVELHNICPHCHRKIPYLDRVSQPGFCSLCMRWLGGNRQESAAMPITKEEMGWQIFMIRQIEGLIAAVQRMPREDYEDRINRNARVVFRSVISACYRHDIVKFASAVGLEKNRVEFLHSGALPDIDELLKLSRFTTIPLADLLADNLYASSIEELERFNTLEPNRFLSSPYSYAELREALSSQTGKVRLAFPEHVNNHMVHDLDFLLKYLWTSGDPDFSKHRLFRIADEWLRLKKAEIYGSLKKILLSERVIDGKHADLSILAPQRRFEELIGKHFNMPKDKVH